MDNTDSKSDVKLGTRRDFIKKTTTLAAAAASASLFNDARVYGADNVKGANDKITVAIIGVGAGIGQNHLIGLGKNASKNNTEVVAICDLFKPRLQWGQQQAGLKDADVYSDYRKVLERKDIDTVLCATHDVWHVPISCDAMDAGKHVYCEKPMSRYLGEAFKVYDKVKSTKKVFQIGAQGCSMPAWSKSRDLIAAGKIGKLVWSQGYYCRNSQTGEWNDKPFVPGFIAGEVKAELSNPQNIDWATWQGQAKKVDFNAERFHRWRKWYAYCAGVLGDLAPHRLHPLVLATGNPEFPSRVVSLGTHNIDSDKGTPEATIREIPEHQQLLAEFPSGYLITLTCGTVNAKSPGFVLYGHKATLNIGEGGNAVELLPERAFSEEVDPESYSGMTVEDVDIRMHEKNFFDCIRNGQPTNGNIDLAVRVQTVLCLAEMSNRLNMTCLFDDKTRTIKDGSGRTVEAITYGTLPQS